MAGKIAVFFQEIKKQITPIRKRSYLGPPPREGTLMVTAEGKEINWLGRNGTISNYTGSGDAKPLSEEAIRTLKGG